MGKKGQSTWQDRQLFRPYFYKEDLEGDEVGNFPRTDQQYIPNNSVFD